MADIDTRAGEIVGEKVGGDEQTGLGVFWEFKVGLGLSRGDQGFGGGRSGGGFRSF